MALKIENSISRVNTTCQLHHGTNILDTMTVLMINDIFSFRNSHPGVFLGKGVLKICSKFTGEHPCQSAISIKFHSNFIEITLRHVKLFLGLFERNRKQKKERKKKKKKTLYMFYYSILDFLTII